MTDLEKVITMLNTAGTDYTVYATLEDTVLTGFGSDHLLWCMVFDADGGFVEFD